MRDFRSSRDFGGSRGGSSYGRRDFNQRGGSSNRGSYDRPQMFSATCDSCGKECQVPFRPTGERPVYCSECFESKGGGNSREPRFNRSSDRDDRRGRSFSDRQMFSAICDSCGNECQVPFRPTGERPVYCSDCFEKNGEGRERRSGPSTTQSGCDCTQAQAILIEINSKLDKIMRDLGTTKFVRVPAGKESKDVKENDPLKTMIKEIENKSEPIPEMSTKKKETNAKKTNKKDTKKKVGKKNSNKGKSDINAQNADTAPNVDTAPKQSKVEESTNAPSETVKDGEPLGEL